MGSCYAKKAVEIALNEVGYQGDGKYCKYSEELDNVDYFNFKKNGAADWCSIFVNWCVYKATIWPDEDVYTAHYMMCEPDFGNAAAGCTQAANYFKSKDQWSSATKDFERGDQVFFKRSDGALYPVTSVATSVANKDISISIVTVSCIVMTQRGKTKLTMAVAKSTMRLTRWNVSRASIKR